MIEKFTSSVKRLVCEFFFWKATNNYKLLIFKILFLLYSKKNRLITLFNYLKT